MKRIGFVSSQKYLRHITPAGHAEQPDRLSYLVKHLEGTGLLEEMDRIEPAPAALADILRVHTEDHVESIRSACERGGGMLDEGDTFASPDSFDVALLAAGGVLSAIDAVVGGDCDGAFCAVRPPGHHAERDRPMGFCLFNNVAVGARYAQSWHGIERVAILDWDVHHGNGTQHIFESDPSVFYISLHQFPWYPGTGAREETGLGPGKGFTLNFPMPEGTEEDAYLQAFANEIAPALRKFNPGLLILSAGFDAHRDDPLAGIRLTQETFGKLTRLIDGIAPIVSVLEGGYHREATAKSIELHIRALISDIS